MRGIKISVLVAVAVTLSYSALAATLDDVRSKGFVRCGVSTGVTGFAFTDKEGNWQGFEPALCQAVAAAIFGDKSKVKITPTTSKTRFVALMSGEIDMLARNTEWSSGRATGMNLTFVAPNYYDGQGFMVPKALGIKSAKDLDGAAVCTMSNTTTELNLADYFRKNGLSMRLVKYETPSEVAEAYEFGRCDVYTTNVSHLATTRAAFDKPGAHMILPEIISKEPLGPLVRNEDDQWADIVRWVLHAVITAEEKGVTQANIDDVAAWTDDQELKHLFGAKGDVGKNLGLDKDWAIKVIKAVGNYGEIFERNIGPKTPIALERGLNALWSDGGLMYSPPYR